MSNHINDTNFNSINIYLNSKEAEIKNSYSNVIFILKNPIFAFTNLKLMLGLTSFTCPNSIYNITNLNNKLVIDDIDYILDVGNYDSDTLTDAINNLLVNETLIFNENDNTFKFTSSSNFTISTNSTILKVLGFSDDNQILTGLEVQGLHICDLAGTTNINVKISNLSMNNLNSFGEYNNIIESININVNYGSYIFYNKSQVLFHGVNDKFIKFLNIQLVDNDNNEIDLNGSSFSCVLTLHYSYLRENKILADNFAEPINNNEDINKEEKPKKEKPKKEKPKKEKPKKKKNKK